MRITSHSVFAGHHARAGWLVTAIVLLAACASSGTQMTKDRIDAIVASPDRSTADRAIDARRKPAEMLALMGAKPGMVALDVSAARGYTSELVARAVGPTGKVYAQNAPRDPARAPPPQAEGASAPVAAATPATLAERAAAFAQIVPVTRAFASPVPPEVSNNSLDLVTLIFNYHDFGHMGVNRAQMNRAIFDALKPGGVYVIADHSGRDGTGISESGTLHRVEEAFVIREVEASGMKLAERGNFLRNPADPRDRNTPVPAMAKDEFVLKFVKP
ncbi:class I SAM-dependent methyltransferase [soil metagenome]